MKLLDCFKYQLVVSRPFAKYIERSVKGVIGKVSNLTPHKFSEIFVCL